MSVGDLEHGSRPETQAQSTQASPPSRRRDIFAIPAPVKQLFDRFPFHTYTANELPSRTSHRRDVARLFVFTTKEEDQQAPSFNPSCLKWQAYLKFAQIPFHTIPSNNHASPTGALPFLLPSTSDDATQLPIPASKLERWAKEHGSTLGESEQSALRHSAYISLLDNQIRNAWLYFLYLIPQNFSTVAHRLYINPCSSNSIVRLSIAHQLQTAAETELSKHNPIADAKDLFKHAETAFNAISTLLGENEWFFGSVSPGIFDASVFSYTRLLMDERMGWKDLQLVKVVEKFPNLIHHQQRIRDVYFHRGYS